MASQCDAKATILANTYKHRAQKELDIESVDYNINQPYRVNLTDSANWQQLSIASMDGTVCSYKFQHKDSRDNVYQVMIKDYSNMNIGIYFYSQ